MSIFSDPHVFLVRVLSDTSTNCPELHWHAFHSQLDDYWWYLQQLLLHVLFRQKDFNNKMIFYDLFNSCFFFITSFCYLFQFDKQIFMEIFSFTINLIVVSFDIHKNNCRNVIRCLLTISLIVASFSWVVSFTLQLIQQ